MRRFIAATMAVAATFALTTPAGADLGSDLAQIEGRIEDLEAAIANAEGVRTAYAQQVLETAAELDTVTAQLRTAEEDLERTRSEIQLMEEDLADLLVRIAGREAVVAQLRATADEERREAMERAVDVYMAAHANLSIPYLAAETPEAGVGLVYADRVQDLADRVIADYEIHRYREQQEVVKLGEERNEAQQRRSDLVVEQERLAIIARAVDSHRADVAARLAEHEALLDEIDHEIAHFEGEIASLAREEDQIRALIAQEQTPEGTAPGLLLRPVPGAVSSGFGWRIHPIYGDERLHTGWDMNGACREPIVAAAWGRVFFSGWKGGYGNAVMIDHGGGLSTLYGHMSSIGVSYGQEVSTGEIIGWVGTTGTSTSCHLHWEVRLAGAPVDPTPYV